MMDPIALFSPNSRIGADFYLHRIRSYEQGYSIYFCSKRHPIVYKQLVSILLHLFFFQASTPGIRISANLYPLLCRQR